MSGPTYLSQPTIERLPVMIKQIRAGEFRIPRFQRPFVWQDEQRLLLLDSIKQGLPIGSILVWRTTQKLEEYKRLGPFRLATKEPIGVRSYVIDGHQRLVTLFSALAEPPPNTDSADDDEEDEGHDIRWPIYYDLSGQKFRLAPRRGQVKDGWVPLPTLLDPKALYAHQKRLLGAGLDQLATRAETLAEQLKDYSIPIIPLFTEELGVVTECFRRVNSVGTKMSEVHMLNALGWTASFDLRKQLRAIKDRLQPLGWGALDEQVLLDALKVSKGLHYYYATPDDLHQALKEDPGALDRLSLALERAVTFLSEHCAVRGPSILPYQLQLVMLCEAARTIGAPLEGEVANQLLRWFWRTTFTEAFTGCSNRDVEEAVALVRAMATQKTELSSNETQVVMPLDRFRASSVRSRAIALRFAQSAPEDKEAPIADPLELLAELGSRAIPKIIPGVGGEGPENRWIVHPRRLKEMRDLLSGSLDPTQDKFLERHLISKEATSRLRHGDVRGFLEARRRDLIEFEREFVEQIGLSYEG